MKTVSKILFLAVLFVACSPADKGKSPSDFSVAQDVILDTDIGDSLDDLLALDILHHYCRKGRINLLAVMVNHDVPLAPQAADVFNTWYGAGQTPIGTVTNGVKDSHIWEDYAPLLCSCESYKRTISDYSTLPDAVALYRKILAESEDKSVTILSIGFLTNISRLLESGPDEYSPLTGIDLMKRKVRSVVAMCGSQNEVEYNVSYDISSARNVFGKLPVAMSIVPGETRMSVLSEEIFEHTGWAALHPVALGYTTHDETDMNMCWDATAALAYVTGFSDITISGPYDAAIDSKGILELTWNPNGNFRVLSLSPEQQLRNKELLLSILGTRIDVTNNCADNRT
ncbi:MAG: nucleoside hydrolase [Bacteroidales bacterium]|nr:nucleoside hydrolase [Candidatus Cryptobacteroides fimicaballi]